MKKSTVMLVEIVLCGLIFIGCSERDNPTQPSRYEQLKRDYIALAGALKTELESFRGKTFKRPVTTAVYTPEEYKRIITQTGGTLSAAKKKFYNDIFKAEGLLHRNADYFAGQDSMLANETGGFYKDGSDSVYLILEDNAVKLTRWDSTALFHELVHALQDQEISFKTINTTIRTSDQGFGFQYAIEGEAELFSLYFYFKYNSEYPPSFYVMEFFDSLAVWYDHDLDSIHNIGDPLVLKQPFYWGYFSYGPKFINGVVGENWPLIDANIYPRLPIKTCVALHPETFPAEYSLQFDRVASFIDSTQILHEVDELGEVLMNVLFREWDFSNYLQLSAGLRADNIVVYRTQASDSVRLGWYTYWQDAAKSAAFFDTIALLINAKRTITLPVATLQGDTSIVNDTLNKVYIEKNADHVFILEDYVPAQLQELITRMRGVKWYVDGVAKAAVPARRYPFIDKSKLVKGWRRGPVSTDRIAR